MLAERVELRHNHGLRRAVTSVLRGLASLIDSECEVVLQTASPFCPGGEIGRRRGLKPNLSPSGETPEVKPVKLGEGPGRKSELMPSQALAP